MTLHVEQHPTDTAALLATLELLPDAHVLVDESGRVIAQNTAAKALLSRVPRLADALQQPIPPRLRITEGDRLRAFDIATSEVAWGLDRATLCRLSDTIDLGFAERAQVDEIQLLGEIIDALGQTLVVLDEHGVIVAANAQWRITARAGGLGLPDDGVGSSYLEACDRADGPGRDDALTAARGIREVLDQRALSFTHEYDMGTPERPQRFRMTVHALHESRGAVITHADVSAIHVEQRARLEALAHFQATFEHALDAMLLVDHDGNVIEANSAADALFGASAGSVVGTNVAASFVAEGGTSATSVSALLTRDTNRGLVRLRNAAGTALDVEYAARADVQPGRHLLVFRDVTELRRLESELRQAQKMEAVGQLTGGIAHDFNNILTVVLGNAEILLLDDEQGARPQEEVEALTDIVSTATRGADTVRKLLAFARKEPLRPVLHDPAAVLTEMSRLLERVLPESIQLRLEVAPGLAPFRVDASALQQMLLNLCTNARDAAHPDGGTIVIRAGWQDGDVSEGAQSDPSARHLVIAVEDDGVGMTPDVVAHLFEPFFTTKEVGKGTGLGMSMVYGIMAQHGGRVSVVSAPGAGTTVTLHFPSARLAASSSDAVRLHATPEPSSAPGARILLVEDNPEIRRVSQQVLTRAGYRVTLAANGADGAAALAANADYDLVVSDVIMPSGGGRFVADAVVRYCPEVPILWITGYAVTGVPAAPPEAAGPWRTLPKPWNVNELLAAVRDAVQASTARRAQFTRARV